MLVLNGTPFYVGYMVDRCYVVRRAVGDLAELHHAYYGVARIAIAVPLMVSLVVALWFHDGCCWLMCRWWWLVRKEEEQFQFLLVEFCSRSLLVVTRC